jgi:DNA polymerase I
MKINVHTTDFEIPPGVEITVDIETTGLDLQEDKILLVGLCWQDDAVHFVKPSAFSSLLNLGAYPLIMHNKKFDIGMLHAKGIVDLRHATVSDTMLLHHLLDENAESNSLEALVSRYFNVTYKSQFWSKYARFEDAPENDAFSYLANDLIYTRKLYHHIRTELDKAGVPQLLRSNVENLASVLLRTELEGLRVDVPYLTERGVELKEKLDRAVPTMRASASDEIEMSELAQWSKLLARYKTDKRKAEVDKPEFNFSSSAQLQDLLYNRLNLPKQLNKKRLPTADYDSLQKIRHLHPIVDMIQDYREHDKVYGSFIEGTLTHIKNGRIYPTFNVNGTDTGRISHSKPNLGQLPASGGIRGIYTPDPGEVWVAADYGQLEVCIAAHITQDKNLLRIINEGISQHDITAEGLGIKRNLAKTLNFGLQYGATHIKVAKILGVSEKEGLNAYNKYWELYSGQKAMVEWCKKQVDEGNPIKTLYGRQRHFEKKERQPWDKAYRQAWNFLVQGTGADMTSEALVVADSLLRLPNIGRGLFTVHDEVLAAAKREQAESAAQCVKMSMLNVGKRLELSVPLKVEVCIMNERWED